jgi:hypothetical protein
VGENKLVVVVVYEQWEIVSRMVVLEDTRKKRKNCRAIFRYTRSYIILPKFHSRSDLTS